MSHPGRESTCPDGHRYYAPAMRYVDEPSPWPCAKPGCQHGVNRNLVVTAYIAGRERRWTFGRAQFGADDKAPWGWVQIGDETI